MVDSYGTFRTWTSEHESAPPSPAAVRVCTYGTYTTTVEMTRSSSRFLEAFSSMMSTLVPVSDMILVPPLLVRTMYIRDSRSSQKAADLSFGILF
jgi:hypothetical protein